MADQEKVERLPTNPSNSSVGGIRDEKITPYEVGAVSVDEDAVEQNLIMTDHDLHEAQAMAGQMSTEEVKAVSPVNSTLAFAYTLLTISSADDPSPGHPHP